jgi:hypothetical protein
LTWVLPAGRPPRMNRVRAKSFSANSRTYRFQVPRALWSAMVVAAGVEAISDPR